LEEAEKAYAEWEKTKAESRRIAEEIKTIKRN
jgi:hypothetical protein